MQQCHHNLDTCAKCPKKYMNFLSRKVYYLNYLQAIRTERNKTTATPKTKSTNHSCRQPSHCSSLKFYSGRNLDKTWQKILMVLLAWDLLTFSSQFGQVVETGSFPTTTPSPLFTTWGWPGCWGLFPGDPGCWGLIITKNDRENWIWSGIPCLQIFS